MAQALSGAQTQALIDILNDPEQAANLSLKQLGSLKGLVSERKEFEGETRKRLTADGLSNAQVEEAMLELDKAPAPTMGRVGLKAPPPLVAEGVIEGAKQAGEGILDLAKDITTGLSLVTEESRDQWRQGVSQRRLKRRIGQIQSFGQLPSETTEIIGEVAPWLATVSANGANLMAILIRRTMQGAIIGGSQMQGVGDTFVDRVWGLTLGGALGGVTTVSAAPSSIKVAIARSFVKKFNDIAPRQREKVQELVRVMSGDDKFAFSSAQVSGSRFLHQLEMKAADLETKTQQNNNMYILWRQILRIGRSQQERGVSAGQVIRGLRSSLKKARKDIYNLATSEWGAGTKQIMEKYGDDVVMRGKDYLSKLDELIKQTEDGLLHVGGRSSAALRKYRRDISPLINPMKVETVKVKIPGKNPGDKERVVEEYWLVDQRSKTRVKFPGKRADAQAKALEINEAFGGPTASESTRILTGLNELIGGDAIIFEGVKVEADHVNNGLLDLFQLPPTRCCSEFNALGSPLVPLLDDADSKLNVSFNSRHFPLSLLRWIGRRPYS